MSYANTKITITNHLGNETLRVKFYDTTIVRRFNNTITLSKWKTESGDVRQSATTKARMNQVSEDYDLGYEVYQSKGEWYVKYKGTITPFFGEEIQIKEHNV